jgi:hypothetical protein
MPNDHIMYICVSVWAFHAEFAELTERIKFRQNKTQLMKDINLMFVDPCVIVQVIKKNPTKCNNVLKFYYFIFVGNSTCFGRHTVHHQEPRTALAASDFL